VFSKINKELWNKLEDLSYLSREDRIDIVAIVNQVLFEQTSLGKLIRYLVDTHNLTNPMDAIEKAQSILNEKDSKKSPQDARLFS